MRKFLAALWCGSGILLLAQDAIQVDPKHFKVEYQDVKTRVVREILGPGAVELAMWRGRDPRVVQCGGQPAFVHQLSLDD